MSNHMIKYLMKEKGITREEAQKVIEARKKKFTKWFREVKNEDNRKEWSKSEDEGEI